MQKRTKMLVTIGLIIVVIGGVVFTWSRLSKKDEQVVTTEPVIEQVVETEIAEEEKFEWVDEQDLSSNPMIVSNPCNIYAEPREEATVLGSLSAEQTGTNIAYAYDKAISEGGIHLGWNKVNFGGIEGYVSLMDVSYDVPMETDDVVAEESESGVSSETESIVETEPKAEETKKEEAKKDEPKKEEPKKEEPQQQAETSAPQPEPQPAPEPTPEPAPQSESQAQTTPQSNGLLSFDQMEVVVPGNTQADLGLTWE